MISDDIYSIESWLRDKALDAHNKANQPRGKKGSTESERHGYYMQERAFNETISKIQNMRCNQRPHVSDPNVR